MNIITFSIVYFVLNCMILHFFQVKPTFKKSKKKFKKLKHRYALRTLFRYRSIKKQSYKDKKRKQDLNLEKIQLNNKLRMLQYVIDFELYLTLNKIDKSRFNQLKEFNDLKCHTQESILESTKKIIRLNAA